MPEFTGSIARPLRTFIADDGGATAIEYGLIVGLLSVAIIGTVFATGQNIKTVLYGAIVTALASM